MSLKYGHYEHRTINGYERAQRAVWKYASNSIYNKLLKSNLP